MFFREERGKLNLLNKDLEGFLQKNEQCVEITVNEMFERVAREWRGSGL